MPDTSTAWHVLGAGSIGCLFAARLHEAGVPTCLLLRPASLAVWQASPGLLVDGPAGAHRQVRLPVRSCEAMSPSPRRLLVCTKAQDTLDALAPFVEDEGAGQLVLLLQNGMGVSEVLRARWPGLRLWNAVTTAGAWRSSALHIHCVTHGETQAGTFDDGGDSALDEAVADLAARDLLSLTSDIRARLWRKLAVNAVINALTAIHHCRNGELLSIPAARAELALLAAEVEAVAGAEGVHFDEPVLSIAESVIRLTAENHSSMNRDVAAGRRTEIDFINGYVVACAARHGIAAPRHAAMVQAIISYNPRRHRCPRHGAG